MSDAEKLQALFLLGVLWVSFGTLGATLTAALCYNKKEASK